MKIYKMSLIFLLTILTAVLSGSLNAQNATNVIQLIRESQKALATNNIAQAEVLSEMAIKLDPAHPPAWRQYGITLLRAGKKTEAITAFKRAIDMDDKDTISLRGMALACWETENHNEAVRALSAYLRLKPEDVSVWRDMATWMTKLERGDQAIAALERVVELEPDNASAWRELGSWQTRMKRYEPAVKALNEAVKLVPDDISAWRDLATGLTHLERYEDAVKALKTVIKAKPEEASTWHDLGIVQSHLKLYDQAVEAYSQSVKLDPQRVSAWRDLAVQLSRLERYDEAAKAFEKVVEIKPDDASARRELGLCLITLKRYDEALQAFRKTVELDPEDAASWRELALLYQRTNNLDETVNAFRKSLEIRPEDTASRRDLGWVLWKQGKQDEALAELTKAVEDGVESRDKVIFQVVALLCEEGASKKALAFMKRVDPDKPVSKTALELARAGRLQAAHPLLDYAWNQGAQSVEVGLYLAYTRAANGEYAALETYLNPLLKSGRSTAEQAEIALETLRLSCSQQETPGLVEKLESILEKNEGYSKRITDILELSADSRRTHSAPEQALRLYRSVQDRDPERESWIWVVLLTERIEGLTPYKWMEDHEKRVTQPAQKAAVKGVLADRTGEYETAVTLLRKSLELKPDQIVLRQVLFNSLLTQGKIKDARKETEWFVKKIDQGDKLLRPYLAEMLTSLGDYPEALTQWRALRKSNPESTYYSIETAYVLYHMDLPEEALEILEPLPKTVQDSRVYELLAEITSALGKREEAAEWASRGLAAAPSQGLLRYHAENLEMMQTNHLAALDSAQKFLENDPGNVPVSLLAGRLMEAIGATNEMKEFHGSLITRNQDFSPSLKALRNIATGEGEMDDAVEYSRRRLEVQPENLEAQQEYANSLAQQDNFRQSLGILRPLTRIVPEETLAVLVYPSPAGPLYDGRNSIKQISEHIKALADGGFTFVNTFKGLSETNGSKNVMIVLIDPGKDIIEKLDPVLKDNNAKVVYAGNASVPALTLSREPIPDNLSNILNSERWALASGGPSGLHRNTVNAAGVLGSPMTHTLVSAKETESPQAFAERLDKALKEASQSLEGKEERILVYPAGDFGQLSLDTDPGNIAILHNAVSNHFTHGVYFDTSGFSVVPSHKDRLRIPGRTVPPAWDSVELFHYINASHPMTRAWLELARTLYWNGQFEAAHRAFKQARLLGADPQELNYNWGMNALLMGDLPTAREKLETAQTLDPESELIRQALDRLEKRRRPTASLYLYGWKDNEDRDHYRYGGFGDVFISERIRLGALADRDRWNTDNVGSEYGTRLGVKGLAFLMPEVWLKGSLWYLDMDDIDNHWGGEAALRLPNPISSGFIMPTFTREEIETVEALRADIDADSYILRTYTRLMDVFDLYADGMYITRSDNNDTYMLDGRLLYRLQEWPYTGIGWRFRFGDSDRDPPEYWAPEQLQQHQLHITIRGAWQRLSGFASAEAGVAREQGRSWDFVWGARTEGSFMLTDIFSLEAMLRWSESPSYERLQGRLGLTGRF